MEIFLTNITSFPVIVFTFLLAIIIVYWLLAMLGAVDIDMFDADFDLDVDVDADIELDVDADVGATVDPDFDPESLRGITGFMLKWGLTGVPVTVVVSILVASAWLISYILASVVMPLIPLALLQWLVGAALLLVSFALAIPVTAQFIRPLKSAFVSYTARNKVSFIGSECLVKTGSVTESFGQAEYQDGGAGMLFDVRAKVSDNITKGDLVILKSYDEEDGSYWVIKAEELN
ncbi:DUF1449 family protein [Marinicella sp. S1101]|uniref:OB-fold-containig protein n=1 Tax=Marinicella marina TaxID=2996016 RepID=UPI002260B6DD|nr:OB-fold-containig protein [Marinicella marina]MCX7553582.1 DUF1449 family protein [Marinicella marina]MDJ1140206.1 DUF1449 family protein [Marinicella marina]